MNRSRIGRSSAFDPCTNVYNWRIGDIGNFMIHVLKPDAQL
jgi:hypothetical protein